MRRSLVESVGGIDPAQLTFDDGDRNFAEHAWPLVKRHGFTAVIFLVAGRIGRTNDRDESFGEVVDLMTWEEILSLSGLALGSAPHRGGGKHDLAGIRGAPGGLMGGGDFHSHQSLIQFVSKRASASSATIAMMLMTVAPMPPIMAGRIYGQMARHQFSTCHWRPTAWSSGSGVWRAAWRSVQSSEGRSMAKECSQWVGNSARA